MDNNDNSNAVIKAVVSIRYLALGLSNNWSNMKSIGLLLENELNAVSSLVKQFSKSETQEEWVIEKSNYKNNLNELKLILSNTITKIKSKNSENLSSDWNSYQKFSKTITQSLSEMHSIGRNVIPENKTDEWNQCWEKINNSHSEIKNEAEACYLQLKLIEEYSPEEVNNLTDTILKHIPAKYSIEEAEKYNKEYLEAYEAIKKEASQKKNIWDKFLDILAGGIEQTPAQRVMMQRWVNGEKGENSL
ncbi:hypothetical protein [uncultured Tenacibaculum sp.]|uniref:hypothetical protein n=1 Tax=uncultured Tenacibaculum sp. TaxID=174713 RepID=UPI002612D2B3|nr:hypothetical protein [uncultured Tenacibaculum sp.]